jgi:hypothetical protein
LGSLPLDAGRSHWLALALLILLVPRELDVLRYRLPQNARLVPETVFRLGAFFGPFQFGVEMGSGLRTYVSSTLPYMLIVAVFFESSFLSAVAASLGFALGRALMTSLSAASGEATLWDRTFKRQRAFHRAGLVVFLVALATAWAETSG